MNTPTSPKIPLAFGHAQLAKAVVNRIQRHFRTDATRRSAVEQSLVVGVFGEWGSGKSSLLHAVKQDFDDQPDEAAPVVTVFFNAWRYEKEPHLIVPLLNTIQAEIKWAIPSCSQDNLPIIHQADTPDTNASVGPLYCRWLAPTAGVPRGGRAKLSAHGLSATDGIPGRCGVARWVE